MAEMVLEICAEHLKLASVPQLRAAARQPNLRAANIPLPSFEAARS